ncbi:cysteine--tRNA ligase [Usitatibacter palustris]|uniref:Cysteine--tRNA ligase n=1 Tax=Usitatibacter palustris TaxID=2732487 RepID=A0A6M4H5W1_9PROT|nr:cysteine--tRNA ligase [Usitatibacter palustris]QJR14692.1 Cysteine--tRNA ligase [Usitatibacter palustris]
MSELTIYNTLTRAKERFVPHVAGKAGLYVCGPTVYDYIHIGNARTFTTFDMVARWLRTVGLDVTYVRNVTDIDDKIIDRANERGIPFRELAESMAAAFNEDCARLKLLAPDREPRATKYVDAMLGLIETLETKGLAYRAPNGDVYFSVRDFPGYGKLSRRNLDDLRAGERVAVETAKKDPLDFALWKSAKPGEPSWSSKYGDGRPGWHIECSAMAAAELGTPVDLHGGAVDLTFPHHENEIAQSEGAGHTPFTRCWMHGAFLNMDSEKMSKSLGNFFTLREILAKLDPVRGGETVRFFLLRGHYRSEINYTWETLEDAGNTLLGFYTALREVAPANAPIDWSHPLAARFRAAMSDDFDTPVAFAVLHELRGEVNRTKSAEAAGLLKALGATLGFFQTDPDAFLKGGVELDVEAKIAERKAAKAAKDFGRADAIRKELEAAGVILEDKPGGNTEWRRR